MIQVSLVVWFIDEVGVPEFVKGNQGISAVEKLLAEFEAHEPKRRNRSKRIGKRCLR
jgi:hypothetical protein